MNVTEQSMLSSYASGEILSARQKADNGRPKGDVIKNWWEILVRDVTVSSLNRCKHEALTKYLVYFI